jgi:hypothetical protein
MQECRTKNKLPVSYPSFFPDGNEPILLKRFTRPFNWCRLWLKLSSTVIWRFTRHLYDDKLFCINHVSSMIYFLGPGGDLKLHSLEWRQHLHWKDYSADCDQAVPRTIPKGLWVVPKIALQWACEWRQNVANTSWSKEWRDVDAWGR